MKKSFILSLVMVVVLIASLATATYAWYTAQTQVNTSVVEVTTAGAGKSIVISSAFIDSPTYTNKVVTLASTGATAVEPMILAAQPTAATTLEATFVNVTLNDTSKVNGINTSVTPAYVTSVKVGNEEAVAANRIYINNTGATGSTYTVKVIIDDANSTSGLVANKGLRVAVFKALGKTSSQAAALEDENFTLVGIWAPIGEKIGYQSSTIAIGDTFNGTLISDKETQITAGTASSFTYANETAVEVGTLAAFSAGTNDVFAVCAWYEGANITNAYQNTTSNYQIYFDLVG